jgi:hypothetical protein
MADAVPHGNHSRNRPVEPQFVHHFDDERAIQALAPLIARLRSQRSRRHHQ